MKQQKKLNIKGKYLVIGFILLILIAVAAAWCNFAQQGQQNDGFSLAVSRDGKVIKTFTLQELKKMPQKEVYADLQSAQHENAEGDFKGVELQTVLSRADTSLLKECDTFICVAGDGYSSALSGTEIMEEDSIILVAWEKDESSLEHFNEGGEGPMRLLIASDTFGNRSTKFLTRIECRE